MPLSRLLAFCLTAAIALITSIALGKVQIEQKPLHQTVGISGLSDYEAGCSLESFVGRIAKRIFADDALTITDFVVEHTDGTSITVAYSVSYVSVGQRLGVPVARVTMR